MWSHQMCRATRCKTCGKTTWAGCGQQIDQVKAQVSDGRWCPGHPRPDGPRASSHASSDADRNQADGLFTPRSVPHMQRTGMDSNQSPASSRPHGSCNVPWRSLAALALVFLTATGCGSSQTTDDAPKAASTAGAAATDVAEPATVRDAIDGGAEIMDVRTPEEFATGHLQDAVNIDLAAPDFTERIAALEQNATYVVYCASGNRAGQAIQKMTDQGFNDLSNGGGYKGLAAAGLPTA